MAEIILPLSTTCVSNLKFGLLRADNVTELLSGAEVITEFPKAAWYMQVQLRPMKNDEARAWRGALAALSRMANYFLLAPPDYRGPVYSGPSPSVDGSGQIGFSLNISGASANTTILLAGEYFTVNGELKVVTYDCVSNGVGDATVVFEPPLRQSPVDATPLVLDEPKCKFRLSQPRCEWEVRPGKFYFMTVDAVEAIPNA